MTASQTNKAATDYPVINELIIKLASRCNINCSYCYWFNDPLVMRSPKVIQAEVIDIFLLKLLDHIKQHQLKKFSIGFHGGEPTLFPKERFEALCNSLLQIADKTGCSFNLSLQSNALLIDDHWIELLKKYQVRLGVSLDGNKQLHDKYRIDMKGRGTYLRTKKSIEHIQSMGLEVYILSVANASTDPDDLINHFVYELGLQRFDVMIPHLHHGDDTPSLADYYCKLYDRYQDELIDEDVEIRILDGIMSQSVGGVSSTQGYGFISTATLLTDGFLEAIDDLRMIKQLVPSEINIKTHSLQQVTDDPLWQEIYHSSLNLSDECTNCEFKRVCGGGIMVSRWSADNRFNNPSVYCSDIKKIIQHVNNRLAPHLDIIRNLDIIKNELAVVAL